MYVILEIARKNRICQCPVVELLYLHYRCKQDASRARHPSVMWSPSVPQIIYISEVNIIKQAAWLRNVFTLLKFI